MSTLRQQISKLILDTSAKSRHDILSGHDPDDYVEKLLKQAEIMIWLFSGQPQALVAFYANDPNLDCAFISMVIVSPEKQRQGIATAMIQSSLSSIAARGFRRCRLEVHPRNTGAAILYKSLGFEEVSSTNSTLTMEVQLPRSGLA